LFNGVGGSEIILVLLVVLLLFGSKRIPTFSRALGRGIAEVRRALREIQEEFDREPGGDPKGPTAEKRHTGGPGGDDEPPAG